jgi:hypothetical protein
MSEFLQQDMYAGAGFDESLQAMAVTLQREEAFP